MIEKGAFALRTFPLQLEAKRTRESRGIITLFSSFWFSFVVVFVVVFVIGSIPQQQQQQQTLFILEF